MIIKSSVICAFLPTLIFSQKPSIESCVCIASVPNKEFFFSPILSSIITAEIPNLSKVLTVNTKCSILPPVSPSKITGLVVHSKASFKSCKRVVKSTASISGLPFDVESVRLLDHIPSNSLFTPLTSTKVFSIINPVNPL